MSGAHEDSKAIVRMPMVDQYRNDDTAAQQNKKKNPIEKERVRPIVRIIASLTSPALEKELDMHKFLAFDVIILTSSTHTRQLESFGIGLLKSKVI